MSDEMKSGEGEGMGRRGFLLLAGGALAAGVGVLLARRYWVTPEVPGVLVEDVTTAADLAVATIPGDATVPATGVAATEAATARATQVAQSQPAPEMPWELFPDASGKAIATAADAPVIVIPRSHWTDEKPRLDQIQLMGGYEKITVHHTGFATPWETDTWAPTRTELENIRDFHAGTKEKDRHWADIAYHFVVDRAGRVWQARPMVYQGAHVKGNNTHNIGVVLLGNFDLQKASAAQLTSLCAFILFLRGLYKIGAADVHTHGELGKTDCPGSSLRQFVARTRAEWIAVGK